MGETLSSFFYRMADLHRAAGNFESFVLLRDLAELMNAADIRDLDALRQRLLRGKQGPNDLTTR